MRDQPEDAIVPELDDTTLDFLLTRGGLSATDAQRAGLKAAYVDIMTMADRVRKPRGRVAEPALTFGFAEEDLR
jgi:hypothetical protein